MNITREKRIIRFIENKYDNANVTKYIEFLLSQVNSFGEIPNYPAIHSKIKDILFNGSSAILTEIYITLLNDNIIRLNGTTLIINCYSVSFLTKAEDELRFNNKRPYKKQVEGQQEFSKIMNSWAKISYKVNLDQNNINASISELILGVKCPRYFLPYLTGKRLTEEEINSLSPEELLKEEARRNLSKECILLLLSYMAICNYNGIIPYFNIYSVSNYLIEKVFDSGTKNLSTLYLCHNKLLELGFVRNCSEGLQIVNYANSFGKNKNYVVIPHIIFKRQFKKMHIGSMRLFFEWVFMLNNGECSNKNLGAKKKIYFRAFTTEWNTVSEKEKYKSILSWLRKRCKAEVKDLICPDDDFTKLNEIFNITINEKGILCISIRENYYISKRYERKLRMTFDAVHRFKRKAEYIRKILLSCTFKYTEHDLSSFTQILRNERNNIIRYIIMNLEIIYKTKKEYNGKPIENLPAYLAAIYRKYKSVGHLQWNPEL